MMNNQNINQEIFNNNQTAVGSMMVEIITTACQNTASQYYGVLRSYGFSDQALVEMYNNLTSVHPDGRSYANNVQMLIADKIKNQLLNRIYATAAPINRQDAQDIALVILRQIGNSLQRKANQFNQYNQPNNLLVGNNNLFGGQQGYGFNNNGCGGIVNMNNVANFQQGPFNNQMNFNNQVPRFNQLNQQMQQMTQASWMQQQQFANNNMQMNMNSAVSAPAGVDPSVLLEFENRQPSNTQAPITNSTVFQTLPGNNPNGAPTASAQPAQVRNIPSMQAISVTENKPVAAPTAKIAPASDHKEDLMDKFLRSDKTRFAAKDNPDDIDEYRQKQKFYTDMAARDEILSAVDALMEDTDKIEDEAILDYEHAKEHDTNTPYIVKLRRPGDNVSESRGGVHFLERHTVPTTYTNLDLRKAPKNEEITIPGGQFGPDENGEVRCDCDTFFKVVDNRLRDYTKTEKINLNTIRVDEVVDSTSGLIQELSQCYPTYLHGNDILDDDGKFAAIVSYDELKVLHHCNFDSMKSIVDEIHKIFFDDEKGYCDVNAPATLRALEVLANNHSNESLKLQNILLSRFNEAALIEMSRFVPDQHGRFVHNKFYCEEMSDLQSVCEGSIYEEWIDTDTNDYVKAVQRCLDYSFGAIWSRGLASKKESVNYKSSNPPYLDPTNPDDQIYLLAHAGLGLRFGTRGCISAAKMLSILNTDEMTDELKAELISKLKTVVGLRIERRLLVNNLDLPTKPTTKVDKVYNQVFVSELRKKNFCAYIYNSIGVFYTFDPVHHPEQLAQPMVIGCDWDNNIVARKASTYTYR